jgi:cation transport regulator ChaB
MPTRDEDIPSTLQRSPKKVRDTYEKTLDSAHESYDSEERAHRTAWSAVKHVAEKKGDHWEAKDGKGPSDPQAARGGREARESAGRTYGGVDASRSKDDLYAQAREIGIEGRSKMRKDELARALQRANDRATARARS